MTKERESGGGREPEGTAAERIDRTGRTDRAARLAAELRENLRRRKAQGRARRQAGDTGTGAAGDPAAED